jgi:hypothetical protein
MEDLSAQVLPWNIYKRIVFRFVFIFFILFIVFLDWSFNPVFSYLYYEGNLAGILDSVISWLGKDVFRISYIIISPYDGQHHDRTYVYLLYFAMAASAAIGTITWSAWDRKRTNYETAYYWFTAIIRYYLAFTMLLFALEKFFKVQFPDLGLYTLTEPVGNLTPMSLAWAFFGYSYGYNVFIGIAESAALLLLFRRTMVFGAILTLVTLVNVMAVNFSYDVHAKMYPTALFMMTFFLLLPYLNRLIKFLFTNQVTSLPPLQAPLFKHQWMNISKKVFKFLLIGYFTIFPCMDYYSRYTQKNKSQSELSGVFDVKSFVVDKDTLSDADKQRWYQIVLAGSRGRIRLQGDSVANMFVSVDNGEFLVYKNQNHLSAHEQEIFNEYGFSQGSKMNVDSILIARQVMSKFQFKLADSATLMLNGTIGHNAISIAAKKRSVNVKDFRLIKNSFHWVTE